MPSAVRAATTTGNPRCRIRSSIRSRSLIGTSTPPAPSTIHVRSCRRRRKFKRIQSDSNSRFARRQVRRNRRIEAVTFRQQPFLRNFGPRAHRFAVRAFDGARLHRLPIDSIQRGDQQRGKNGLADVRVRAGDEIIRSSGRRKRTRAAEVSLAGFEPSRATRSASIALESFAVSDKRSRAVPGGTVGGRIARTPKPRALQMRGKMSPPLRLIPGSPARSANRFPRYRSRFAAIVPAGTRSDSARCARSASAAAARSHSGGNLRRKIRRQRRTENKCARAIDQKLRSVSEPQTNAPAAASALPQVCTVAEHAAGKSRLRNAAAARGPHTPVAWASSTISSAP